MLAPGQLLQALALPASQRSVRRWHCVGTHSSRGGTIPALTCTGTKKRSVGV
jgi:hypothetical protein